MSIKILFTDATVASAGDASAGSASAGGARAIDTSPEMNGFPATDASPTLDGSSAVAFFKGDTYEMY